MIVNDRGSYYEWIDQHEHARVSGLLFLDWADPSIGADKEKEVLYHAIRYHDRAWIPLDKKPRWNEKKRRPYSFIDYPEKEKIAAYERGITETGKEHVYSGLLSSRHYTSFFKSPTTPTAKQFVQKEKERQRVLRKEAQVATEKEMLHFKLLQWMDDISLYMCMNEPGATKEEEVSWFRHGFRHTFSFLHDEKIVASFVANDTIEISPYPFLRSGLEIVIETALIDKETVQQRSITAAFSERKSSKRTFQLIAPNETS